MDINTVSGRWILKNTHTHTQKQITKKKYSEDMDIYISDTIVNKSHR